MRLLAIIAYALSALLLAGVGGKVSEHFSHPWWHGAVVGLVFHLPGVMVMSTAFVIREVFYVGV